MVINVCLLIQVYVKVVAERFAHTARQSGTWDTATA